MRPKAEADMDRVEFERGLRAECGVRTRCGWVGGLGWVGWRGGKVEIEIWWSGQQGRGGVKNRTR